MSLHVKKDGVIVSGKLTKNRNGSTDAKIAFTIKEVTLGEDEYGEPVTTALCQEAGDETLRGHQKLAPQTRATLKVFNAINDGGPVEEDRLKQAVVDGREVSASDKRDTRAKAYKRNVEMIVRRSDFVRTIQPDIQVTADSAFIDRIELDIGDWALVGTPDAICSALSDFRNYDVATSIEGIRGSNAQTAGFTSFWPFPDSKRSG